ncbi:MAG: hypothetical protein ACI3XM_00875 [Eubacteriales bacterium]
MGMDRKNFINPPSCMRVFPMTHDWNADYRAQMDAYRDFGYGGAVTNVPFGGGFTSNRDNIRKFGAILDEMEAHGLGIWIYDEHGYPSGQGGGLVLEGHPELAAKGFYMVRRIAYEPTHVAYRLDDISDKIIWAAKYPLYIPRLDESYVRFDRMEAVPFTKDTVDCDLGKEEILYIFCVKNAHEGSHSTHNVSSFKQNINIMDERAVRRFLDLCFEPIAEEIPDAYRRALHVFTDEPSLQTSYARAYEVWPYALAPWVDGLFEAYEAEYGESMLPTLPLIFEGGEDAYPVRVKFYELIGKRIAASYSGQINAWCEEHGCSFSGHYICEEAISQHVMQYGSYIRVLMQTGYPGIDVLACYPEIYDYNTAKYAQIAVRKKHTNGMMVEICPFNDVETFARAPLDNMTAVMGYLYLSGVRRTNSYFAADLSGWQNNRLGAHGGYTDQAQTNRFNEYVGRLGVMLDGLHNDCNTFVYYGLEEAQAKEQPVHSGSWQTGDRTLDITTSALTRAIYERGHDFYYADRDDLLDAVRSLGETGVPVISGCGVKTVLVPTMDVMYGDSMQALASLAEAGVRVFFIGRYPRIDARGGSLTHPDNTACTDIASVVSYLDENDDSTFSIPDDGIVLKGRFRTEDGKTLYMLCSKSRSDTSVIYRGAAQAQIWDPEDGSVSALDVGAPVCVRALRALFVMTE